MADVRTDYMPLEEFKHRAIQAIRRGDQPLPKKVIPIEVAFSSFDKFVHDVAYALRHEVVYRSDGGHFARGFVQASGDLAGIHEVLRKSETRPGAQIRLTALFFRRSHADPTMRWAMSVRFLPRTITIDPDEDTIIHARSDVMSDLEKGLAQKVLELGDDSGRGLGLEPTEQVGQRPGEAHPRLDHAGKSRRISGQSQLMVLRSPRRMVVLPVGNDGLRTRADDCGNRWQDAFRRRHCRGQRTVAPLPLQGRGRGMQKRRSR